MAVKSGRIIDGKNEKLFMDGCIAFELYNVYRILCGVAKEEMNHF